MYLDLVPARFHTWYLVLANVTVVVHQVNHLCMWTMDLAAQYQVPKLYLYCYLTPTVPEVILPYCLLTTDY